MTDAFQPFEQYMDFLAQGTLDPYIDSICRTHKITVPEMTLSTEPNLLLHELGRRVNMERVERLFDCGTTYVVWNTSYALVDPAHRHLFNTSGSGKTRLILDGLCHKWGIYISCRTNDSSKTGGSLDFYAATFEVLPELSTWNIDVSNRLVHNARSADRIFMMLLCARVFILKQLVDRIRPFTDPMTARRRWVFLQALPPIFNMGLDDIFVVVLRSIRAGDTIVMRTFIRSTMELVKTRKDLFLDRRIFIVLDEAQDAARCHIDCFPSTTQPVEKRQALHELYRVLLSVGIFHGFILSGTGLSMDVVKESIGSMSVKEMNPNRQSKIFTDTGDFTNPESQEAYVRLYLKLSDDNISDRLLLERIKNWFVGRCVYCSGFFVSC
jgi:hypothetical protein